MDYKRTSLKIIVYCLVFSVLHFLYMFFPYDLVALISCNGESVFQHLKLAFYSYIITSVIEYKLYGGDKNFWIMRLLSSNLMGLIQMMFWYIPFVFIGQMEDMSIKLPYAYFIQVMCVIWLCAFEESKIGFTKVSKASIIFLSLVLVYLYSGYTFVMPYTDLFYTP